MDFNTLGNVFFNVLNTHPGDTAMPVAPSILIVGLSGLAQIHDIMQSSLYYVKSRSKKELFEILPRHSRSMGQ
jgi:hypothetical protein